jgi:hypothetical protein
VLVSRILRAALKRDRMIVAFGLAGGDGSVLDILIYMDWGMHLDLGMDMVLEPSAQPPFGGDLVS